MLCGDADAIGTRAGAWPVWLLHHGLFCCLSFSSCGSGHNSAYSMSL